MDQEEEVIRKNYNELGKTLDDVIGIILDKIRDLLEHEKEKILLNFWTEYENSLTLSRMAAIQAELNYQKTLNSLNTLYTEKAEQDLSTQTQLFENLYHLHHQYMGKNFLKHDSQHRGKMDFKVPDKENIHKDIDDILMRYSMILSGVLYYFFNKDTGSSSASTMPQRSHKQNRNFSQDNHEENKQNEEQEKVSEKLQRCPTSANLYFDERRLSTEVRKYSAFTLGTSTWNQTTTPAHISFSPHLTQHIQVPEGLRANPNIGQFYNTRATPSLRSHNASSFQKE
eukprot:TRINITY_DN3180_c0_g1_i5.p1 TRINITY_DN3180_c0_g1~~TRINITY_DN3180_c0_g1_i5.p1  ORF type:complete len:284 (+),score=52.44 TRINITY_DN3180_c0_g1_i5:191-1042(+)